MQLFLSAGIKELWKEYTNLLLDRINEDYREKIYSDRS